MGLSFNLGRLSPSLFTDSSLNVGIGAAPSGTYKFEVTGTAKVSSTLLLGGALTGTSGSFSSTITAVGLSKFWDGTQGLNIGAATFATGYGAIYSTGVTPSSTNFCIASNGASTVLNATNDASIVTNNGNGLVVMSTGNVIINNGTTDSGTKLQIVGGINFRSNSGYNGWIISQTGGSASAAFNLSYGAGGASNVITAEYNTGEVTINGSATAGKLTIGYNFFIVNDQGPEIVSFVASSGSSIFRWMRQTTTESMRITSGGYLKATSTGTYNDLNAANHEFVNGTASANSFFVGNTNTSYSGATLLRINGSRTTTNSTYNLIGATNGNSTGEFLVRDSGNCQNTNNSYTGTSDIKLKQDIIDANSQWDDIKQMRIRKFRFKKQVEQDENAPYLLGVIAQEIELISPNLVDEALDFDGTGEEVTSTTKSVKYSIIYMKAVKALQEAMTKIEELNERLNKAGL